MCGLHRNWYLPRCYAFGTLNRTVRMKAVNTVSFCMCCHSTCVDLFFARFSIVDAWCDSCPRVTRCEGLGRRVHFQSSFSDSNSNPHVSAIDILIPVDSLWADALRICLFGPHRSALQAAASSVNVQSAHAIGCATFGRARARATSLRNSGRVSIVAAC
jgi:hypothetical protein